MHITYIAVYNCHVIYHITWYFWKWKQKGKSDNYTENYSVWIYNCMTINTRSWKKVTSLIEKFKNVNICAVKTELLYQVNNQNNCVMLDIKSNNVFTSLIFNNTYTGTNQIKETNSYQP